MKIDTENCFLCENLVNYPNKTGLLYLGFPRVFILYENTAESYFTDYDNFIKNIAVVNWLEPNESKYYSDKEKEEVLIKLWNFLCLEEEEEENLSYIEDKDDYFLP